MKNILVIGATGKQGRAVVTQLLKEGFHVRAFTRNKAQQLMDHPQLEMFEGQLSHYEDLFSAMAEQDGVYSLQPVLEDVAEEVKQGQFIIQAAEAQQIKHIVYSTAGGVNRNRTIPHFAALAEIENTLKVSTLNYTII